MAILYIIKNVFLLLQMLAQNRFVYNNRFATQRLLLRSYLVKPYEYFLDVKSGDVLQVINKDTETVFSLLSLLLTFVSEIIVSVSLIVTILIISPFITVCVASLMFFMIGFIQIIIRPILSKMGSESRVAGAGMQQWLLQAIQGIKELKITKSENYFERQFNTFGRKFVKATYIHTTLSVVPRFLIEAISMASFFAIIAFQIYRGVPLETLFPVLSGVAMAAMRLLPSVNRITHSLASITYGIPSVDNMSERLTSMSDSFDLSDVNNDISLKSNGLIDGFDSSITMKDVDYKYPKGSNNVLTKADIEIKKGESVGIVGTSGAGKTTAVDILLGLLEPCKGKVFIDRKQIYDDMGGWLNLIGYIPQNIFMLDGDIRSNVAIGIDEDKIDDDLIWNALREASLDVFVRQLPDGIYTQLGERGVRLSGGQKQRIGIARALYKNPEILFFDEATSALDNETEKAIMESINSLQGNKTLIIIAHRLTTIENCNHIFRIENGSITQER